MIQINWAYLCDYSYMDAGGKVSLIGMFDNILTKRLPVQHNQFYLAISSIITKDEPVEIGAVLSSPSSKEIKKIKTSKLFPPNNNTGSGKAFLAFGFFNIEFYETGEHRIEIFVGETCVHSIPFNIILVK